MSTPLTPHAAAQRFVSLVLSTTFDDVMDLADPVMRIMSPTPARRHTRRSKRPCAVSSKRGTISALLKTP